MNQNVGHVEKLNALITTAELTMYNIQTRYTAGSNERNQLAKSIIDRNDELCILHETLNKMNANLGTRKADISEMENKIKNHGLISMDLRREIVCMKAESVTIDTYVTKTKLLEEKIKSSRSEIMTLSDLVENSRAKGRTRFLKGKDLDEVKLVKKIEAIEEALAAKEEKLNEKEMVLDEVNALTDRLQKQTFEGRSMNTTVAEKLNQLTKKIKNTNRSLMAKASELAMVQSKLFILELENEEKKSCLKVATEGLSSETISLDDFEKDLIRAQRRRIRLEQNYLAEQEKKDRQERGEVEMYPYIHILFIL